MIAFLALQARYRTQWIEYNAIIYTLSFSLMKYFHQTYFQGIVVHILDLFGLENSLVNNLYSIQ